MGNLDARRDWGYAKENVEAMWLMLQQPEPDDYVIATNETHTIRECLEVAFGRVGLDWQKYEGSVLTFDTKGAIATYWLPGWPLRGWMDWAGRRLCRPPAGGGGLDARPSGALGKGRWGAFSESAEGTVRPARRSSPTGSVPGVRCGRLGDRRPTGGAPGLRDAGLQGGRSGCGSRQRVAWNSSRLGVRIARRWRSLRFRSPQSVLTCSRTESGTWPNRVSRTSIIASRAFWMRPS